MTTTSPDMGLAERFTGQVVGYYTGGMIAYMIGIGHPTGLFEAAAGFTGITVTSASGDPWAACSSPRGRRDEGNEPLSHPPASTER